MKTVLAITALLAPTDAFSPTSALTARTSALKAIEIDDSLQVAEVADEKPRARSTEPLERALADGRRSLATGFVTANARARADWLDALFGFRDEDALKRAARAGQSTWTGAMSVAEADPFGLEDEARTAAATAAREFAPDPFLLRDDEPLPGGVAARVGVVDALGMLGAPRADAFAAASAPAAAAAAAGAGAAAAASSSRALPFLPRPAALDAAAPLAGDAGFDPLGLATPANLPWMRDAELKHARFAMLAALGWPISEALHPTLAKAAALPSTVAAHGGLAPSVLNGGLGAVPVTFWVAALGATIVIELTALERRATGGAPGDLGWDPLKLNSPAMAEYELAHGRLAMLAITAFAAQEFVTKLSGIPIPVIHQLP